MKLLSWNIDSFRNNINDVIDVILQEDPDIVCIQELLAGLDRNVYRECRKKRILDTELDVVYRFKFFSPNYETYPYIFNGRKVDNGGLTQQGNYLLSKCKFISAEQIFYHRNYKQMREDDWYVIEKEWMPCSIQVVDLDTPRGMLRIINNHGLWTDGRMGDERTQHEIEVILKHVKSVDYPVIIAGDFNLLPESESFKILSSGIKELVTSNKTQFTAEMSGNKYVMDYIFMNGITKVKDFRVLDTDVSDHLPIIVEF